MEGRKCYEVCRKFGKPVIVMEPVKGGKASACIKCGKCERACPQHLPIRELLVQVAEEFEKN